MTAKSSPKILCIDDDPTELSLTSLLLEKAGYTVFTARDGEQALKILTCESIDLVLSDHRLCGMTGAELAKRIKELHPAVLVVLFSGVIEPPPGSDQYTDMFIDKGVGPAQVLDEIRSLLGQEQFRQQRGGKS